MARKAASKGGADSVSVDLSSAGTSAIVPEGDHRFKVLEVTRKVGNDSGQPYLVWKVQATDVSGAAIYENTSLQDQSLFALRGMLEACGYDIPKSKFNLALGELKDLEFGGTVEHEIYDKKPKAKLSAVFSLDELDGSGSDDDADEPEEDDTEPEDDAPEVNLEEMTLSELKKLAKEYELNVAKIIKPAADNKKKQKKLLIAALEELAEADDDDDEDE